MLVLQTFSRYSATMTILDGSDFALGDIVAEIFVSTSARRFFLLARAHLRNLLCEEVSVSFDRPRLLWSRSLALAAVTPTERNQADHQLADLCDRLSPQEIELAERVHEAAWLWLRERRDPPPFDYDHPTARVHGIFRGRVSEVLESIEGMTDTIAIRRISVGTVYMSGRPARPYLRMLPAIEQSESIPHAIEDLDAWSANLSEPARNAVLSTLDCVRKYFDRRANLRRNALRNAAHRAFGREGGDKWLTRDDGYRGSPINRIDSTRFEDDIRYLTKLCFTPPRAKKVDKIRAWRADG